jgi:hypothetical protein
MYSGVILQESFHAPSNSSSAQLAHKFSLLILYSVKLIKGGQDMLHQVSTP